MTRDALLRSRQNDESMPFLRTERELRFAHARYGLQIRLQRGEIDPLPAFLRHIVAAAAVLQPAPLRVLPTRKITRTEVTLAMQVDVPPRVEGSLNITGGNRIPCEAQLADFARRHRAPTPDLQDQHVDAPDYRVVAVAFVPAAMKAQPILRSDQEVEHRQGFPTRCCRLRQILGPRNNEARRRHVRWRQVRQDARHGTEGGDRELSYRLGDLVWGGSFAMDHGATHRERNVDLPEQSSSPVCRRVL
mmetsp:Transcript_110565/g.311837  ORF Transcript_110565/g.311837 Transcript_110565/m.311837 type:complete len:247 (-) Transcript_110565:777-1517(-)